MSLPRPRHLWPLLTAALIGLPVLYVLSVGPLHWLWWNHWIPEALDEATACYCKPLLYVLGKSPVGATDLFEKYVNLFRTDRPMCPP